MCVFVCACVGSLTMGAWLSAPPTPFGALSIVRVELWMGLATFIEPNLILYTYERILISSRINRTHPHTQHTDALRKSVAHVSVLANFS